MESTNPSDMSSKKKIEGRIDQKLEVHGSIFNGRDENHILKQQKYMQQNEIRKALEMQILEKKRLLDEERKKQLEHDKKEELRIQNDIQYELQNEDKNEPENRYTILLSQHNQLNFSKSYEGAWQRMLWYKQKRPSRLNPQFVQTQFAGQKGEKDGHPLSEAKKVDSLDDEEEYKETPSLSEVKASDIHDQSQSNRE